MPYFVMRKIRNRNLYSVKSLRTGRVYSYGTTKAKAIRQMRMLNADQERQTTKEIKFISSLQRENELMRGQEHAQGLARLLPL
jgi:hypothetical protein